MLDKKYWKIIFIAMVAAQLYFPLQMIWSSEKTISEGTEYKFKTVPVDPYDPFRGKYISLRYEIEREKFDIDSPVRRGQVLYALLDIDQDGYARVSKVSLDKPTDDGVDYIKVTSQTRANDQIVLRVPFDRFYMEESLALPAEEYVRSIRRDTTQNVYGLVRVLGDNAILTNIIINGEPIADVVRREMSK